MPNNCIPHLSWQSFAEQYYHTQVRAIRDYGTSDRIYNGRHQEKRGIPTLAERQKYALHRKQGYPALAVTLRKQLGQYHPDCFILLECQALDSSHLGDTAILPVGGDSTLKSIPNHPISIRGLASDMSVVTAILEPAEIPAVTENANA